ncbi:hypothetical protein AnigIFM63309_001933 [Aspergillus niger]|nr:hypothetical protein AnigIFM49718_011105 [Aspergillus niger]GKZ66279.1 hypothetical protein AnigIFM50267_011445 [Aspergillus niger]GLA20707.1 hypothetical protein AnigIFM62618_009283 [Aspergillus niger]GLA43838.1 hypothetical protein AnigIFM63309_001933 [Aspergillus niger]
MRMFSLDSRRMRLLLRSWQQQQQQQRQWRILPASLRACSSLSERLHRDLTSRRLPLTFDYLHPQPSFLLSLTLAELLPTLTPASNELPSAHSRFPVPAGHHLVYFPPQVTLSQILPDGTDTLHAPGSPFDRRLWAGGSVRFSTPNGLVLNGSRAVCIETIRDVVMKGRSGEEKVMVRIERRIGAVQEGEDHRNIRERIWKEAEEDVGDACVIETRNLLFMRKKTPEQLSHDKAGFDMENRAIRSPSGSYFLHRLIPNKTLLFRFSALTFNAHSIHIDKTYTQDVEGYRNLLVHGPLTLALLLAALQGHLSKFELAVTHIEYRNIAPLYVDEELAVCGKPKSGKGYAIWDVWIEGRDGRLAVRGTAFTSPL